MALNFKDLKKARDIQKLMSEVEKTEKKFVEDDRFWKLEVDKAGNGQAEIRFLPPPKGEDLPWVQIWTHGFQGPTGKWYIENCRSTIGEDDPVNELNNKLWNSVTDDDADERKQARRQKRKLQYISNILVVNDPQNPENEGKVFLFKYGAKIFEKIKDLMKPEFDDSDPINPFDFDEGANFKLRRSKVAGYPNYDKSAFSKQSALFGGDEDKQEEVWNAQHSLAAEIAPDQFKSYDELKKKLMFVLNDEADVPSTAEDLDLAEEKPRKKKEKKEREIPEASADVDDDDDDSLSYFAKLAEDD